MVVDDLFFTNCQIIIHRLGDRFFRTYVSLPLNIPIA